MMVHFKTETGSCYKVDTDARVWEREGVVPIRTRTGVYDAWSGARVGQPVWFTGEGLVLGTRLITTSSVIEVSGPAGT